jgi:alpha-galactosidase
MLHIHSNQFHLQTKSLSYIFSLLPSGHPEHLYFGTKLKDRDKFANLGRYYQSHQGIETAFSAEDPIRSLQTTKLEFSSFGKSDYREPSIDLEFPDGSRSANFLYKEYKVHEGLLSPKDLPCARADKGQAQTLELVFTDRHAELQLYYSVIEEADVILRWCRIINTADGNIQIHRILSSSIDIEDQQWELITLPGKWIQEKQIQRAPVHFGVQSIDSKRLSSGADFNPFLCLCSKECSEQSGEAIGLSLIYSGNFLGQVQKSPHDLIRMQIGIQPFNFCWELAPGSSFDSPQAVLSYSHTGLEGLSRNFHHFISRHIIPRRWQSQERPILFNSWEAMYFTFDEDSLLELVKNGKELGMELFVLDDGWFKGRNNDRSSLGDWNADPSKLPSGIEGLSKKVKEQGLAFGLWFEPEMVSPVSDLFSEHPQWAVSIPGVSASLGRHQLILDLSNPEVRKYIIESLDRMLPFVDYVKWDMNRSVSDIFSQEMGRHREFTHRYILGLYEILEDITARYPNILFENCASGGNRFDMGMLYYFPQTWGSDNTDPYERSRIQYGSSLLYPPSTITSHVGADPNHQVLRKNSIETRFHVALSGVLGYELDLRKLSEAERKIIKSQVIFYKEYRKLLQFGEFYRIQSPFQKNISAWLHLNEEKSLGLLTIFQKTHEPNSSLDFIRIPGLNQESLYKVSTIPVKVPGEEAAELYPQMPAVPEIIELEKYEFEAYGDQLGQAGFKLPAQFIGTGLGPDMRIMKDFSSRIYLIEEIDT